MLYSKLSFNLGQNIKMNSETAGLADETVISLLFMALAKAYAMSYDIEVRR